MGSRRLWDDCLVAGLDRVLKSPGSLKQVFLWSHVRCTQQGIGLHIRLRLERNQLVVSVALTAKEGNPASRSVATVLPLEIDILRSPMDWPWVKALNRCTVRRLEFLKIQPSEMSIPVTTLPFGSSPDTASAGQNSRQQEGTVAHK